MRTCVPRSRMAFLDTYAAQHGATISPPCALPPFWTPDALALLHAKDARSYDRGRKHNAFDDGDKVFPSFDRCLNPAFDPATLSRAGWEFAVGMDLSGEARAGTWLVTVGMAPTGRIGLVDARHGKWNAKQKLEQIMGVDAAWRPLVIGVESNAFQKMLIEWAQWDPTTTRIRSRLKGHETGNNKNSRDFGLPALELGFSLGAWDIPHPDHPSECQCSFCVLIEQFREYVLGVEDQTQDAIMATWIAATMLRVWGGSRVMAGITSPAGDDVIASLVEEQRAAVERYTAELVQPEARDPWGDSWD